MAFWSGNGGGVTCDGGAELNVGTWSVNHRGRLAENTHSGTGGASNYELVVQDNDAEINIPIDDTNLPEVDMGFDVGVKVTLVGQIGNSTKTCTLTNTTVENVRYVNDPQGDIARAVVTTKGGAFTGPST